MNLEQKSILIIDDDQGLCLLLEKLLGQGGFVTHTACNGKEAVDILQGFPRPDLIILDIIMPVMDGFQFLDYLKKRGEFRNIPVIILTVKSDEKFVEQGIILEADFYLPKPLNFDNLMGCVASILGEPLAGASSGHPSLKKFIAEIGEIEYKIVSTRQELEEAMALVYQEYAKRGFILPEHYKSRLRVTAHHAFPETVTFVGLRNKEVVATSTLVMDSAFGLPMDKGYHEQTNKLRQEGRKICEVGYLAIKSGLFRRHYFSMFNFNKLDFMFTLFKVAFQYAIFRLEMDDMCIVVDPKKMVFKFLPFKVMGKAKYYGFDYSGINKKPAVAKRMDLRRIRHEVKRKGFTAMATKALNKIFLGDRVPADIFQSRYSFTIEDISYFLVKKSDVWSSLSKKEKDHILSCYGVGEEAVKGNSLRKI